MRNNCLVLALLFLSSISACEKNETEEKFDFRMTRSGITLKEVLSSETAEIDTVLENCLAYYSKVMDIDVHLFYEFENDSLYKAKYVVTQHHKSVEDFIDDYEAFKWILIQKYGPPIRDGAC